MNRRDGASVGARSPCARWLPLTGAVASLMLAWATAPATASVTQQSLFQDDDMLVYNSPAGVDKTLDTLRSLGADQLRVSVFWRVVAPDPLAKQKPNFDASDPNAYPAGTWDRYDFLIREAQQRGLGVNLNITGPAPLWATGDSGRSDIENIYKPSPSEFALFVRAVGRRYSGSFAPASPAAATQSSQSRAGGGGLLGELLGQGKRPPPPPPPPQPAGVALGRISYWSIWNEPNQGGWLAPQWAPPQPGVAGLVEASPALYRGLLDAAWSALGATGHAGDTVLIGETAPKGLDVRGETRAMKPLPFIRALYCVDTNLVPLTGDDAAVRSCPSDASGSARFATDHPVLFAASGWAHHPYELTFAPSQTPSDPQSVTIADLWRLESTLDVIRHQYGQAGGMPVFLTEFGYITDPPNPAGVTLAQQAAYLNEAEFIAYNDPRVHALSQFLLVDDKPLAGRNGTTAGYYGATFQTGLEFLGGHPKPSLQAYRIPIFLPHTAVRRGHAVRVWGMVRNAPAGAQQRVAIQFAPNSRSRFATLAVAPTLRRPAYLDTRVRLFASGVLRLTWRDPSSGRRYYSRLVAVHVRRR